MDKCEHCRFWDRTDSKFGKCRRYAPRAAMTKDSHATRWPKTQETAMLCTSLGPNVTTSIGALEHEENIDDDARHHQPNGGPQPRRTWRAGRTSWASIRNRRSWSGPCATACWTTRSGVIDGPGSAEDPGSHGVSGTTEAPPTVERSRGTDRRPLRQGVSATYGPGVRTARTVRGRKRKRGPIARHGRI